MVKGTKETIKYLSALVLRSFSEGGLILILLMQGCANQLPPGGGEVDKVPPEIVDVYPPDGTTNFQGDHLEIEFSKYVVKSSLNDALFISPAVNGQITFDWTGKSVDINFPEPLKKNVTYVITVGTDLVDYNNHNRMANSYTFTFSTGNEIDKRTLAGKVYDQKADGVMIFAYKIGSNEIDPLHDKPDYISQTGSDGTFKISGLAEGKYRLFAIRDQYKDMLFQPSQDEYGCPSEDIFLARNDSAKSGINFMLTKRDTIPPRLISSTMTDEYHILVGFTKDIDSSVIRSNNFYLFDSTASKNISPVFAFKGTAKPAEMVLVIQDKIPLQDEVFLFARKLKDTFGNIFEHDHSQVTISDRADTSKPGILKTIPDNGYSKADFSKQNFVFYFTDAFDTAQARTGISLTDTLGHSFGYDISYIDDASFKIMPVGNLEKVKDYRINFDLSKFRDKSGNSYDTTYVYKFKTISGIDFTGVSGRLEDFDISKNPVLVLQGIDGDKARYEQKIKGDGKFNFTRIEPGNYNLWCYYDSDDDGKYTYGWPFPFKPAEEFFVYDSNLKLKPRWTLTDVSFKLK